MRVLYSLTTEITNPRSVHVGICGGRIATGTGFSPCMYVFVCQAYQFTSSPFSRLPSQSGTVIPLSVAVPRDSILFHPRNNGNNNNKSICSSARQQQWSVTNKH
jgi:hypothetical protein